MSNDRTQEAIAAATAGGWQIVSRDATGIQFRKPKQWQKGAVIAGVVLLLFWGFGLIVLLFAALDYAIAKDRLAYLTAAQLAAGQPVAEADRPAVTGGGLLRTALIVVGLLVGATVAVGLIMRMTGR